MLGPKFGKAMRAAVEQKLRSLQSLHASNPDLPSLLSQAVKTHFSLAGPATAATYQSAFGQGAPRFGTAMLLGGSAAVALTQGTEEESDVPEGELQSIPWVDSIASQPGIQAVSCPGLMLRNHPIGKLIAKQDHLFGTMMGTGQIRDFICFYDGAQRRFHSVVHFGREVCGYPQTVHGGLTAAVIDETLGGLCISLWKSGALGFRPPAYTARLEVDYKQKVPAGGVVLCSTEVESIQDRKVWMRATVTDGKGTVYATGRALFVAPRLVKLGAWGGKPQGRPAPEAPGAA